MRVTPYRTTENKIEGVVAALFDITDLRGRAELKRKRS
jgi:hypothetical protein